MFGVDWQEFLIIGIVALVVIGPKDLPRAMRVAGQWVGKARATARHFRSGIDTMIREAELEEMNERWAEQNKAIMAGTPVSEPEFASDLALPKPLTFQSTTDEAPPVPLVAKKPRKRSPAKPKP